MFTMIQKCSLWNVFNVFVAEPLKIHYIKEISKKINLAPTSVKKHLEYLLEQKLIFKKKGDIFFGFIANRDNEDFLFYKKIANIIKLKESGIIKFLINTIYPQAIIVYGSFLRGEDIEESDIDIFILTNTKKNIETERFEAILKRRVHIIMETSLKKIKDDLKTEIINGLVLYGYLKDG